MHCWHRPWTSTRRYICLLGILWMVLVVWTPAAWETESRKQHHNRHHGIIGINLRRHLGLRLLLLQQVVRATIALIMSLGISGGCRTTWRSETATRHMEVGAIVTAIAVFKAKGTTATGGVMVVTVTWDIMINTLQKKTATIIMSMAE